MDNSIYEVMRDDYVGFLNQIKKDARSVKTEIKDNYNYIKTFSVKTKTHLCTRMVPIVEGLDEKYYIFNMPLPEERCEARPIRKIVLETKEEVQAFIDALAKIQKEHNQ